MAHQNVFAEFANLNKFDCLSPDEIINEFEKLLAFEINSVEELINFVEKRDVVTRHYQNNDTQIWILEKASNSRYRVKQKSSGRYLDAHGNANNDFRLVTRERQENQTQLWEIRLGCSNAGRRCIEGFADNLIPYSVVINK